MPLLEKWAPLRPFDVVDRRMQRFFEDLGGASAIAPAADVYETDGEIVVELEVPGFDEKQLAVEITDHTLAVKGERGESTEKKDKALHVRERLERRFERRFELPLSVDAEHVKAEYAKGVLTVHVPKTIAESPRKIAITKA